MPPTRDLISEGYDAPVAAFLGPLTATPLDVMIRLPGGQIGQYAFVASPDDTPDNVAGSDLTVWERAWMRAMYRYMRTSEAGAIYSLRLEWLDQMPGGRRVLVRIMPRRRAPEDESYCVYWQLQSQYR